MCCTQQRKIDVQPAYSYLKITDAPILMTLPLKAKVVNIYVFGISGFGVRSKSFIEDDRKNGSIVDGDDLRENFGLL